MSTTELGQLLTHMTAGVSFFYCSAFTRAVIQRFVSQSTTTYITDSSKTDRRLRPVSFHMFVQPSENSLNHLSKIAMSIHINHLPLNHRNITNCNSRLAGASIFPSISVTAAKTKFTEKWGLDKSVGGSKEYSGVLGFMLAHSIASGARWRP